MIPSRGNMRPIDRNLLNGVWRWICQLRLAALSCKNPVALAHVFSMLNSLHQLLMTGMLNENSFIYAVSRLSEAETFISRNIQPGPRAWGGGLGTGIHPNWGASGSFSGGGVHPGFRAQLNTLGPLGTGWKFWGDPHVNNRAWGDPHVHNRAWGDPHVDKRGRFSPSVGGM